MITLKNDFSSVSIDSSRGGLITSLKIKGQELLWLPPDYSSTESSWPAGGIPICFPFAGRVWHNQTLHQYGLSGKVHHMPLHGFAFASHWELKNSEKDLISVALTNNEATKIFYPFNFELRIDIKLEHESLKLNATVKHLPSPSDEPSSLMPVALGWHPYFKVEPENQEENSLNVAANSYHVVTPAGAAGKLFSIAELGPRPWKLSQPLLNSLIFTDLFEQSAKFQTGSSKRPISIKFGPTKIMNHVVVWSNDLSKFYCVEPWMSLPDAPNIESGCHWLKPDDSLSCFLEIGLI